ncbi:MAG: hypothetical protein Q9187_002676 [Circinaria calcarea]
MELQKNSALLIYLGLSVSGVKSLLHPKAVQHRKWWKGDFALGMVPHFPSEKRQVRALLDIYGRDAGLALVAYLGDALHGVSTSHNKALWMKSRNLNVLELGSGCGIVGIALAQMVTYCNVLLTDLPEAIDILTLNVSAAKPAHRSKLKITPLNWDSDLPPIVENQIFNVILVSDCTYNADSLPSLVRTLSRLISHSTDAHIIVSMKVRHPSEAVFFDLMSTSGLEIKEYLSITMPGDYRNSTGLELETVDIYTFQYKDT